MQNTMYQWCKRLVVTMSWAVLLAGCSGGSNGAFPGSTSENTSIRQLPVDPGPAADATVAGVDTNNNNVRDDVERHLSEIETSDSDYQATIAIAATYQKTLKADFTETDFASLGKTVFCLDQARTQEQRDALPSEIIFALTFNTRERLRLYETYDKAQGVRILDETTTTCTQQGGV